MVKENKILAIDIGCENLKMAEFHYAENGGMTLEIFAFRKMVRAEGESNREVFSRYYHELLAEYGFTANAVRISLSAQNSFQRLSKLPPVLGSKDAVDRIVENEAEQTVPYAIDEIEWGYQLLYHEWEEMVPEEQEDGTIQEVSVKREENEALFIAMRSEDVVTYTDVIEESGKTVLSVDAAPVALFNAALAAQIKEDECALLINIGGSSTSLMIADHRRVFMRTIPTAGEAVTSSIAREFAIERDQAEDFKRRYGFVALGGAYEEPESELAAKISKLTRNVMTRLHGEISRSINVWRAQHGGSAPTRVLLAGGGSTMMYTTDFFNEKLRVPAEYLNTYSLIDFGEALDKELLQSAATMSQALIGLGLRGLDHAPLDISLLPRKIKKQVEFTRRKPFLYASVVTLLVCLLIVIFGLNKLLMFETSRITNARQVYDQRYREFQKIDAIKGELDSKKDQYNQMKSIVEGRKKWSELIDIIQSRLPKNMWLVAMEYESDNVLHAGDAGASGDGEYSEETVVASSVDPDKRQTITKVVNSTQINRIRLVGYTLGSGIETASDFLSSMKAYAQDEKSLISDIQPTVNNTSSTEWNLYYFEYKLTLREPMKK
ncbi:MAG: pilus assembly protein PilM [Lentisphaeria bacterium]|nr:pilus assembly protein PilM [Lentisphaeria bacterium]